MNNEQLDEELRLNELEEVSDVIVWWLVLGLCLIPAVAHGKIENSDKNLQFKSKRFKRY